MTDNVGQTVLLPPKKWYAVYTKPNFEKKICQRLTGKGIEAWCPINRTYRQWTDRIKLTEFPLIRGYIFVKAFLKKENVKVLETDGVLNFVRLQGKPAIVRDEDIATLHEFLQEYTDVKVQAIRLRGFEGQRVILKDVLNNKVVLELPELGFSVTASLSKSGEATIFLR
jgi:transcription antitermination factor NusG